MSVAALRPSAAVFREDQHFAWWVYALLALMAASAGLALVWITRHEAFPVSLRSHQVPLFLTMGLGLPTVMIVGVLRMTTLVMPNACHIWFGWLPTIRYDLPVDQIRCLEVVTYRPFLDCKGWGVRHGPDGERVFNARGNRGVRVHLADGTRLLIGSQRPEELARALEQARLATT